MYIDTVTVHGSLISYYDVKTHINFCFSSENRQNERDGSLGMNLSKLSFIEAHDIRGHFCEDLLANRPISNQAKYFAFSTKHKHNTLCTYLLKLVFGNPHVQHACRIVAYRKDMEFI